MDIQKISHRVRGAGAGVVAFVVAMAGITTSAAYGQQADTGESGSATSNAVTSAAPSASAGVSSHELDVTPAQADRMLNPDWSTTGAMPTPRGRASSKPLVSTSSAGASASSTPPASARNGAERSVASHPSTSPVAGMRAAASPTEEVEHVVAANAYFGGYRSQDRNDAYSCDTGSWQIQPVEQNTSRIPEDTDVRAFSMVVYDASGISFPQIDGASVRVEGRGADIDSHTTVTVERKHDDQLKAEVITFRFNPAFQLSGTRLTPESKLRMYLDVKAPLSGSCAQQSAASKAIVDKATSGASAEQGIGAYWAYVDHPASPVDGMDPDDVPAGQTATLRVHVAGVRSAGGDAQPLAGVKLHLYRNDNPKVIQDPGVVQQAPGSYHWGVPGARLERPYASCVSDASGYCTFTVPAPAEGGQGTYYWVGQESAPDGWHTIDTLRVGFSGGTVPGWLGSHGPSELLDYAYRTPEMFAGMTATSGDQKKGLDSFENRNGFMNYDSASYVNPLIFGDGAEGITNARSSSTHMVVVKDNPELRSKCGLKIQVLADYSTSLDTNKAITRYKDELETFVNSLVGTGTQLSFIPFTGSAHTGPQAVVDPVEVNEANAKKISGKIQGRGTSGDTNWDDALRQTVDYNSSHPDAPYDAVLMITDGNPTRSSEKGQRGEGNSTDFAVVENAMMTANAIKAQGTRVFAIGVESIVNGGGADSAFNMKAISGETGNSYSNIPQGQAAKQDYIMASHLDDLSKALQQVALDGCTARVTVEKQLNDNGTLVTGQDVNKVTPGGWVFDATRPTNDAMSYTGAQIDGKVSLAPDGGAQGRTGDKSRVTFDIGMKNPTDRGDVTISERTQDGWTLQKDPQVAVCTNDNVKGPDGRPQPVAIKAVGATGFTVPNLGQGSHVSCVVVNSRVTANPEGIIKVVKVDEDGHTKLSGSQFVLRKGTTAGPDWSGDPLEFTTGDSGQTWTSGKLKEGIYYIVETQSPRGHSLLPQPVGLKLTKSGSDSLTASLLNPKDAAMVRLDMKDNVATLIVSNVRSGGTLPHTGGNGVMWYLLVSMALIGGGLGAGSHMRHRRKV